MIRVQEGVALLEGDLTLVNASDWMTQGETVLQQGVAVFDLEKLGQLDSSALSLLLSLRRRAQAAGANIEFRHLPASLVSLAKLYGVAEQI